MKNSWLKTPDAPATLGQKKMILILQDRITKVKLVKGGEVKTIEDLTMGEADLVIKKLSKIKNKPDGKNREK